MRTRSLFTTGAIALGLLLTPSAAQAAVQPHAHAAADVMATQDLPLLPGCIWESQRHILGEDGSITPERVECKTTKVPEKVSKRLWNEKRKVRNCRDLLVLPHEASILSRNCLKR